MRKRITETFDRAIPGGGDVSVTLTAVSGQNPIRCSHVGGRGEFTAYPAPAALTVGLVDGVTPPVRERGTVMFSHLPGVIQRADGRVSGRRFTPSIIPRADGRDVEITWALRCGPRQVALPTATMRRHPTGVGGCRGRRLRGPVLAPLYYADQPWSAADALVGAMQNRAS